MIVKYVSVVIFDAAMCFFVRCGFCNSLYYWRKGHTKWCFQ